MAGLVLDRRKFLGGLGLALAAPIIVQASNIMPVKQFVTRISYPLTLTDHNGAFKTYRIIGMVISDGETEMTMVSEETRKKITTGWTESVVGVEVGDYISISGLPR